MSRRDPECAQDPLEVAKASLFKCSNRLPQLAQRAPATLGTWWGPRREAPTGCVTFWPLETSPFWGPAQETKTPHLVAVDRVTSLRTHNSNITLGQCFPSPLGYGPALEPQLPHPAAMATTTPQLTRTETVSLAALSAACGTILANTFRGEGEPLIASLALSGMAYAAAYSMIRWLGPTFIKAGLKGVDMSKTNRREIPECAGAICAVVYLLAIIVFAPFPFYKDIVAATSGGGNRDVVLHAEHVHEGRFLHKFPHSKVSTPPTLPPERTRWTLTRYRLIARVLPLRDTLAPGDHHPRDRRRPL